MTKASNKTKQPEQFKQLPKLTRKQSAFVKELVENPKQSATQAVLKTYNVTSNHSAEVIASENLRKPEIVSHLSNYSEIVENNITNTAIEWANSPSVKERTLSMQMNTYIHDKIHGKATQRTENTNLNLNIETLLNELDRLGIKG